MSSEREGDQSNTEWRTLSSWLGERGELDARTGLRLLRALLTALALAPSAGYTPTPQRVQIRRFGERIDARFSPDPAPDPDDPVALAYRAPEELDPSLGRGTEPTAIYQAAALTYTALTRAAPYSQRDPESLHRAIRSPTERASPLAARRPDLPAAVAALVDGALATLPAERPASLAALVAEIDAVLATVADPPSPLDALHARAVEAQRRGDDTTVSALYEEASALPGAERRFGELLRWVDRQRVRRRQARADTLLDQARQLMESSELDSTLRLFERTFPVPEPPPPSTTEPTAEPETPPAEPPPEEPVSDPPDETANLPTPATEPDVDERPDEESSVTVAEEGSSWLEEGATDVAPEAGDDESAPSTQPYLRALVSERRFPLDRPTIILGRRSGRAPTRGAGWRLVDLGGEPLGRTVSRRHARLDNIDGTWLFRASPEAQNLTLINGAPVTPEEGYPLTEGDTIQLGGLQLFFHTRRP